MNAIKRILPRVKPFLANRSVFKKMCKVGRALRADSLANFSGILAWAEISVRSLSRNFAAITRRISAEFNREDKLRLRSHKS